MKDKVCSGCKKPKPLSSFSKNKRSKDGLRTDCMDCAKIYLKEYYQNNKERLDLKNRDYVEKNREKVSDLERIKTIYTACQKVTEMTKKEHHVDHIIPLKGENICGLHVWWNLRIVPAKINLSKGNRVDTL